MGIDAIALLKGDDLEVPARLHVQRLDDATLVHTGVRFGDDVDMMACALRTSLGDALDRHDDPRGVFVLPDVAEPRARTYEGVVAEIGEAGEWVPKVEAGAIPASLAGAPAGSFEAMMGQAMQALGGANLADIQRAIASGDFSALERMQAAMAAAVGGEAALNELATQLLGAAQEASAGDLGGLPGGLGGLPGGLEGLPIDLGALDAEQLEAMADELAAILGPEQLDELRRTLAKKRGV